MKSKRAKNKNVKDIIKWLLGYPQTYYSFDMYVDSIQAQIFYSYSKFWKVCRIISWMKDIYLHIMYTSLMIQWNCHTLQYGRSFLSIYEVSFQHLTSPISWSVWRRLVWYYKICNMSFHFCPTIKLCLNLSLSLSLSLTHTHTHTRAHARTHSRCNTTMIQIREALV
jgi:hypothetical protein